VTVRTNKIKSKKGKNENILFVVNFCKNTTVNIPEKKETKMGSFGVYCQQFSWSNLLFSS
jgi:hypothetical protein